VNSCRDSQLYQKSTGDATRLELVHTLYDGSVLPDVRVDGVSCENSGASFEVQFSEDDIAQEMLRSRG
jgi:hypothetical protein